MAGALLTAAAGYACGGDNEVFGPNGDLIDAGKSGDGGPNQLSEARPPAEAAAPTVLPPSAIALGDNFACVVAGDRAVYCWGKNDVGQVGRDPANTPSCGTFPCAPIPAKVEGLPDRIANVVAGKDFACARDEGNEVWCWGGNGKNQVRGKGVPFRFTPAKISDKPAFQLEAAGEHACIMDANGFVFCWGDNTCGLFGNSDGGTGDFEQVQRLPEMKSFAIGPDAMCAVAPDTSVVCWGNDHKGSLGHPLNTTPDLCNGFPFDPVPKRVAKEGPVITFTGAADVHVGLGVTCIRTTEGKVLCVGDNTHGGLGLGLADANDHRIPAEVPSLQASKIVVAGETGCALVADRILCWGDARYGQLEGTGTQSCGGETCRPLGFVVPGQQPLRDFALSAGSIATIKADNSVYLWGLNDGAINGAKTEPGNVACGSSSCVVAPKLVTNGPSL